MPDFDAIVIGSGMSGGWAAKELCERGLKVLVLERGRQLDPAIDYKDALQPWERPNLDRVSELETERHYPIQKPAESTKQFWVKDDEHPFDSVEGERFDWLRGYHTGGRSLMWARQTYRLGPQDFEANRRDGHGIDWPIRYPDLAPWYDKVERFAGISGNRDGLAHLPDGIFQPPFEFTPAEEALRDRIRQHFPTRRVIHARCAHLTAPTEEQMALGRGACQSRSYCHRGCSFGAYFSSMSATLPAAERTGNYTLVANAIVEKLDYDPASQRISGVRVIDSVTRERRTYTARVVFLNASTVASTAIMLNSTSETFQNGLANRSGELGRNLMDHLMGGFAIGELHEWQDRYHAGRAPAGVYIPRYANITEHDTDFVRGFGFQGMGRRLGWSGNRAGIGADFKSANRTPGPWFVFITAFGEMLPRRENRMYLHPTRKDAWGQPTVVFDVSHGDNDRKLITRAGRDAKAMLEAAGATNIFASADRPLSLGAPGKAIHEMGTARMGADPRQSVLNGWCQAHDVANLFVTDGSAMASGGCQNPSLTYMALSARAAHHAADLLQDNAL